MSNLTRHCVQEVLGDDFFVFKLEINRGELGEKIAWLEKMSQMKRGDPRLLFLREIQSSNRIAI
ncbi:hypothetical protein [Chlorogloeopsis sp. ULAP02]|uniref:hypothetical protein n=1 Tax=Chlorogloeopsis sp. ULAP02 TaxID=3107926 RepID=UPI0031375739